MRFFDDEGAMRFGDVDDDPEYTNFGIRFDRTSTYVLRGVLGAGATIIFLQLTGAFDRLPIPLIDAFGENLIWPMALTIGRPFVADMPADGLSPGFQRSRHFVGLLGCLFLALSLAAAARAPFCTATAKQRLPHDWRRRRHWETTRPFKLAFVVFFNLGLLALLAFLAASTKNGFSGFFEQLPNPRALELIFGVFATTVVAIVAYGLAREILLTGALRRYLVDD